MYFTLTLLFLIKRPCYFLRAFTVASAHEQKIIIIILVRALEYLVFFHDLASYTVKIRAVYRYSLSKWTFT